MLVVLEDDFIGFPQSSLDELYVKYDEITFEDDEPAYEDFYFTEEDSTEVVERFNAIKSLKRLPFSGQVLYKDFNPLHL